MAFACSFARLPSCLRMLARWACASRRSFAVGLRLPLRLGLGAGGGVTPERGEHDGGRLRLALGRLGRLHGGPLGLVGRFPLRSRELAAFGGVSGGERSGGRLGGVGLIHADKASGLLKGCQDPEGILTFDGRLSD